MCSVIQIILKLSMLYHIEGEKNKISQKQTYI